MRHDEIVVPLAGVDPGKMMAWAKGEWPKVSQGKTYGFFAELCAAGRLLRARELTSQWRRAVRAGIRTAFAEKYDANAPWDPRWEAIEFHASLLEEECGDLIEHLAEVPQTTDSEDLSPREFTDPPSVLAQRLLVCRDDLESLGFVFAMMLDVGIDDSNLDKYIEGQFEDRRRMATILDEMFDRHKAVLEAKLRDARLPAWMGEVDQPAEGLWWLRSVDADAEEDFVSPPNLVAALFTERFRVAPLSAGLLQATMGLLQEQFEGGWRVQYRSLPDGTIRAELLVDGNSIDRSWTLLWQDEHGPQEVHMERASRYMRVCILPRGYYTSSVRVLRGDDQYFAVVPEEAK